MRKREYSDEERKRRHKEAQRRYRASARTGYTARAVDRRARAKYRAKRVDGGGVKVEFRFDEPRGVERSYGELRYEPCDEGGYAIGGGVSEGQGRLESVVRSAVEEGGTRGQLHAVAVPIVGGAGAGVSGVELRGDSEERRVAGRLAELLERRKREGVKVELVL